MRTLEDDDTVPTRSLDRLARAAAIVLDVGVVVISVVDDTVHQALGSCGLLIPEQPAHDTCALCRAVALSGRPVIVQLAANRLPVVSRQGWGVEFVGYAGVPLSQTGGMIGAMAAFSATRRTWQQRDLEVLRTMADAAAAVIDMWQRCEKRVVR